MHCPSIASDEASQWTRGTGPRTIPTKCDSEDPSEPSETSSGEEESVESIPDAGGPITYWKSYSHMLHVFGLLQRS